MKYAVCMQSAVPVRAEPFDRSEMVSQLLFGETMEITDTLNGWFKIKMMYDGSMGWVDGKQVAAVDNESYSELNNRELHLVAEPVAVVRDPVGLKTYVLAGSSLPGMKDNRLILAGRMFQFEGYAVRWKDHFSRSLIVDYSLMYEGVPYMWGGRTPFGIDCSGFTQMVYRLAGISLPRDAGQQALHGQHRSFVSEARPGDIAFFDDNEGRIVHAGIVLSQGKIIHASGSVRIDSLDHQGIFNHASGTYSHMLRVIRYYFE